MRGQIFARYMFGIGNRIAIIRFGYEFKQAYSVTILLHKQIRATQSPDFFQIGQFASGSELRSAQTVFYPNDIAGVDLSA